MKESSLYETANDAYSLAEQFVLENSYLNCSKLRFWRGKWHEWNGSCYHPTNEEAIERKVFRFIKSRTDVKLSTIRGVVELLRIAQSVDHDVEPPTQVGDTTEFAKFFVRNGCLQIRNGALSSNPPDPSCWNVAATDYCYDSMAHCDTWRGFLGDIWKGEKRPIGLLQEWFGYCLTQDTSQQKIFALIGPPRSGKSTIARVLTKLIGRDRVANPSIRSLSGSFGLWALLDRSLAIIPDATLTHPCPALEELLKAVSGEDCVDVHRKGLPPLVGVKLPTRFMLLANELPAFQDKSHALEARLIVLNTAKSFFNKEDRRLTEKLLTELPGILNWSVVGLMRLWRQGRFSEEVKLDAESLLNQLPDKERVKKIVISYE